MGDKTENITYIRFTGPHVHCAYDGRRIFMTPVWLWQGVGRLRVRCEQVCDRCKVLLHLERPRIQVHLIVFLAHLVRYTASPRLDAVEDMSLFVVTRLANVDLLLWWEASRTALVVTRVEHHEAAIHNVLSRVIAVPASLHHFVLVEALRGSVHRLLRAIVPARIDPLLLCLVLPHSVDLGHYGLFQVVRVADVDPVA